jgi:sugar transferase (PEP-CTERM/EpsH1 system associated)
MKLLVILSRVPWPLDKGDKLRAYHQIRQLARHHQIELIALNDKALHPEAEKELSKYCSKVHIFPLRKSVIALNIARNFFSGKPLQAGYFYDAAIHAKIRKIISDSKPDHIYAQLVRVAEYVREENIPKTIDYQDALSAGLDRRRKRTRGPKRHLLSTEFRRMQKYEAAVFDDFDFKTIITTQDRDLIAHPERNKIAIVPNGVDMEFFHPMEMEKEYDIVFTGNMSYPPNVLAAQFLVRNILPIVQKELPSVRVLIAGAAPAPAVQALASEQVKISGWMDDIRTAYASSRIFVAPMQIGTGLQNKLLEAMAMKIPAVTSKLANKALQARPGEYIRVASEDKKEQFAHQIIDLLQKPGRAVEQAELAFQFVKERYSWEAAVEKLEQLWE